MTTDKDQDREELEKETLKDLEATEADDVKGGTVPPTHAGCLPQARIADPELTT